MKITQVRNATQIIQFAGKKFLIDPMLADKGSYPGIEGSVNSEIRNPTVELPFNKETLLSVDAVIVTHTHLDHWDDAAIAIIPKNKIIYVQNESDKQLLSSQGFTNLRILSETSQFEGIALIKTACQHGSDLAYANPQLNKKLGESSGVVFKHPSEKTLYLMGDSIWFSSIEDNIKLHTPDVVIMNIGWAHILGYGSIIFGQEDIVKVHFLLPDAQIVGTHMEALNHCLVTRQQLLDYATVNGMANYVCAPEDGETVTF
ncbi:MBL fold metallo-hydrolase [Xenorhabdus sp. 12]|uniref:MBL fold metallo-hydrolase n=1 Tax=Xenorhabdus santafensis TaxID=2582833 RepID=A0ABU4S7Y0_9GAMM|nr:MBL fold metallo-hydrolase [Xenorhabdus sp. 12]MDX7986887.1 MBL fold metallo-hydrolase [Xenorhabdus sp. 12]